MAQERDTNQFTDYYAALLAVVLGFACVYGLVTTTRSWWAGRSWQPVPAQMNIKRDVKQVKRQQGETYSRVIYYYDYSYYFNGVTYDGNRITFGYFPIVSEWDDARIIKKLPDPHSVTVWIDPRQPWKAVLERSFRWWTALSLLLVGVLAFLAPRHLLVSTGTRYGQWP
jgi:hypothetical protein